MRFDGIFPGWVPGWILRYARNSAVPIALTETPWSARVMDGGIDIGLNPFSGKTPEQTAEFLFLLLTETPLRR